MASGKIYSIKGDRMLNTTQNNIVVPTGDLIRNKKVDLRVVACVSAISNVDNCARTGNNTRYTTIKKINNHLEIIANMLKLDRPKVIKRIRDIADLGSEEFINKKREHNGETVSCIEMKYGSGGFVTLEYIDIEFLTSSLSNNAFKLYINLLWLCIDKETNKYVERQLTQPFLLEKMGLSKSSTKILKKAEDELIEMDLIEVKTRWEFELNDDLSTSIPIAKKYYKIICA